MSSSLEQDVIFMQFLTPLYYVTSITFVEYTIKFNFIVVWNSNFTIWYALILCCPYLFHIEFSTDPF